MSITKKYEGRDIGTTLVVLDEIVDQLTRPIAHSWKTDHGTALHRKAPCLLDQLRGAIERPDRILTGGKAKMHPDPTNLGALDLEQDIKATVGKYYRKYQKRAEGFTDVKAQLRSWSDNVRNHGEKAVTETCKILSRYRSAILEIFNPHTIEIAASCPRCNMRYAEKTQDGETIRNSALKANADSVVCTACGKEWGNSQFKDLSKQLTDSLPERHDTPSFAIQNFKR